MTLDEYLRHLRALAPMTDGEFAKAIGIDRLTVLHWRHGRSSMRTANVERAYKALTGKDIVEVLRNAE